VAKCYRPLRQGERNELSAPRPLKEKTHASDIDDVNFRRRLELHLLSKCRRLPTDATAMKRAANAASVAQDAQFYARPTQHGVIKCNREFVVEPRLPPLLSLVVVKGCFNLGNEPTSAGVAP
jgi:hypothetical protein